MIRPPLARKFAAMEISALVAGMTTPQAAATVVAAAYASYCALRYVYRRALIGVALNDARAMVAAAPAAARPRRRRSNVPVLSDARRHPSTGRRNRALRRRC